ncbi:MAG: SDR family NAD(P)-dependent oxidoreductase [Smithellaceae bacterium]
MSILKDKIAIVTGAGRGIGKVIALEMSSAGATVVVASRTAEQVQATADEITKKGGKAFAVIADVRSKEKVDNLISEAVNKFGRIDIMVNNAGGLFGASTMAMSEKQWDSLITENLKSVFLGSQAAGKIMMSQKSGSIVNMSSTAGLAGYQFNAAYGAAKAGIINFTKTLALDLAPYKVRVNAIAPGLIMTPGATGSTGIPESTLDEIPLGRAGDPKDVAAGVIYLASDASSFITGETLVMDGGLTVKFPMTLPKV